MARPSQKTMLPLGLLWGALGLLVSCAPVGRTGDLASSTQSGTHFQVSVPPAQGQRIATMVRLASNNCFVQNTVPSDDSSITVICRAAMGPLTEIPFAESRP